MTPEQVTMIEQIVTKVVESSSGRADWSWLSMILALFFLLIASMILWMFGRGYFRTVETMQQDFRKTLDTVATEFREDSRENRTAFRDSMSEVAKAQRDSAEVIIAKIDALPCRGVRTR